MGKIEKRKPNLHVIFFDTNILWHKDKSHAVNPEVDTLLNTFREILDIEIVLPHVVYGELQYQQFSSAEKALEKATEAFDEISAVSAHEYTHKITSQRIRANIKQKIDKWVAEKNAIIRNVPCSEIKWEAMVEKAIWREPPFTRDQKEKVGEKGFRDALILETLLQHCSQETRDATIVFISGDNLLRTTAQKELKDDKRCLYFESINDFASYIKLTQESLTNHFIGLIMSRANEKFFNPKDESCLYSRERIVEKILTEYKEIIDHPEKTESSSVNFWDSIASSGWVKSGGIRIIIGNAQFASLEGKNTYHWITTLKLARLYRREQTGQTILTSMTSLEHMLLLAIIVKWKANVKSDGRFHDLSIESIEKAVSTFTDPTDDQKIQYGLITPET